MNALPTPAAPRCGRSTTRWRELLAPCAAAGGDRNRVHLRRRRPRAGAGRGVGACRCRRRTTVPWTATRCAAARSRDAGVPLPVSQRIPAGAAAAAAGARQRGAHLHRRADPRGRRCGRDAGRHRTGRRADGAHPAACPQPGQWIRRSGEDVTRGAVVLSKGERLTPAALGLAASIGMDKLAVARRPRVALFSTGDELVMPGEVAPEAMKPGAIYNSNRFFLRALLQRLGCEVTDLGIVPDRRDATVEALRRRAPSTRPDPHQRRRVGGRGRPHQAGRASARLARPVADRRSSPASPLPTARSATAHFIGLPGNPVSSFVTFLLLVRPFLLKLQGATRAGAQPTSLLPRHFDWPRADKRREFLRVRRNAAGRPGPVRQPEFGRADLDGLGRRPGRQPAGPAPSRRGEPVRFISFAELLGMKVTVKYFASIREALGHGSETRRNRGRRTWRRCATN